MLIEGLLLFFKLLISHALCDFALQSPFIARAKNRHNKPEDNSVPPGQKVTPIWPYVLSAHALIQAGGVYVVTNSPIAALIQLVSHWFLDFAKCENWTTPHMDQFAHASILVFTSVALVAAEAGVL